MSHVEFPDLTPEAKAALQATQRGSILADPVYRGTRIAFAAFLRQAMKQASDTWLVRNCSAWERLEGIANSLHSPPPPPPPPPTLAQAREAARQLAGPSAEVVHAFLATLREGTQA